MAPSFTYTFVSRIEVRGWQVAARGSKVAICGNARRHWNRIRSRPHLFLETVSATTFQKEVSGFSRLKGRPSKNCAPVSHGHGKGMAACHKAGNRRAELNVTFHLPPFIRFISTLRRLFLPRLESPLRLNSISTINNYYRFYYYRLPSSSSYIFEKKTPPSRF